MSNIKNIYTKKVSDFYEKSSFWTKLYVKIRLFLTPFEKVADYIPKEGVVYDLGCGYGIFSNLLAVHSPKRKVIGIDLSKERIISAENTVGNRKNISFLSIDLKDVNLEKCGTIVIYDVLHHINYSAQEKLIEECFDKLSEDGLLIIKDNNTTPYWKFLWNYLHEILAMTLMITKSDKLSFRSKNGFLNLLFKKGFVVNAVNIPTDLPYPFILYICKKVKKDKRDKGVVFVNPPLTLEERYGSIAKGGRNAPPQGLCCLAATIRAKGYRTAIIDAPALGYDNKKVFKEIVELSPKFVGITASTLAIKSAGKLAEMIKKENKNTVVVIGGPHVTATPEQTLREYQGFDFAVIGEGEETLLEFLSKYEINKDFSSISGIAFRKNKKIVVNPRRPYIPNLDILPLPAWDLLPPLEKFYRSSPQSFDRLPSCSVITSRGCPNQCTFCDRSIFGNRFRSHSPEYVIKMFETLVSEYGIKHLLIDDDTFTMIKDRLKKICLLLIKKKLDLTWTCLARVDTVDSEVLSLMKKAGCWQVLYGIESGSQEVLDKLQKRITLSQVTEAVKITNEAGIRTKGFFILGTPFETKKTAAETLKFMKKINLDDFHMTFFTPFPGTEIYKKEIANKKNFDKKWSKMNEWTPLYIPKDFTSDDLICISKKAFREFYFRPKIVFSYLKMSFKSRNISSLVFGMSALTKYLFSKNK